MEEHHCHTANHHGLKNVADIGPLINVNEVREILDRWETENQYLKWTEILQNKKENMTAEQIKQVKKKVKKYMKALANVKQGELSWGLDDSYIL